MSISDERLAGLAWKCKAGQPLLDHVALRDAGEALRELQQLRRREYYCCGCGLRKDADNRVDVDF